MRNRSSRARNTLVENDAQRRQANRGLSGKGICIIVVLIFLFVTPSIIVMKAISSDSHNYDPDTFLSFFKNDIYDPTTDEEESSSVTSSSIRGSNNAAVGYGNGYNNVITDDHKVSMSAQEKDESVDKDEDREDDTKNQEKDASNKLDTPENSNTPENSSPIEEDNGRSFLTMYGAHRVQPSLSKLPKWLQDYFEFHRRETQFAAADEENNKVKYVAITCIGNEKCGGFSDRLRDLPLNLFIAKHINRVICIYWSRPHSLENFLEPPTGGVDWRCPSEFINNVDSTSDSRRQKHKHFNVEKCTKNIDEYTSCIDGWMKKVEEETKDDKFISIKLTDKDFLKVNAGNLLFQKHSYKDKMPPIYAWQHVDLMEHIFRVMFQPIEPIAKRINETMTELNLVENSYTAVHLRARYPTRKMKTLLGKQQGEKEDFRGGSEFSGKLKDYLMTLANNALHCGAILAPNQTVFFSSDNNGLVNHILTHHQLKLDDGTVIKPVALNRTKEILHTESVHVSNTTNVDYFPVIEDLLIMGGSNCVSHGVGSFGAFGGGISGNRCRALHRKYDGSHIKCPNERTGRAGVQIKEEDVLPDERGPDGKLEYTE